MRESYVKNKELFALMQQELQQGRMAMFTVSGNSMAPFLIHNRDQVQLQQVNPSRLKKGDIILYQRTDGKYILHRITKVEAGGYYTTGDGNSYRDGFVPQDAVLARAVRFYRKKLVIECDSFFWRGVFGLWMATYPIRGLMFRAVALASVIKKRFIK